MSRWLRLLVRIRIRSGPKAYAESEDKVYRVIPALIGNGKKYKQCCGRKRIEFWGMAGAIQTLIPV